MRHDALLEIQNGLVEVLDRLVAALEGRLAVERRALVVGAVAVGQELVVAFDVGDGEGVAAAQSAFGGHAGAAL